MADWHGAGNRKIDGNDNISSVEGKIPELVDIIVKLELEDAPFEELAPVVVDLLSFEESEKNNIIKSVIAQLPFSGVLKLLQDLTKLFLFNPGEYSEATSWLHLIILTRIADIIKDPLAIEVVRDFSQQYQERLGYRTELLKLRGRTQLLVSQVKAKQRQEVSTKLAESQTPASRSVVKSSALPVPVKKKSKSDKRIFSSSSTESDGSMES